MMSAQLDLFTSGPNNTSAKDNKNAPLAERMKPERIEDYIGQEHIMERGVFLKKMIADDRLSSLILYGPPGTGKTSLARVIARSTKAEFITINAVISGIKDIKAAVSRGEENLSLYGRRTVLFIDEIHRFNKLQQDALLPNVESGSIILIGATTENPYFEVNSALISRSIVCRLEKLSKEHLVGILRRAISDERGLMMYDVRIDDGTLDLIAQFSDGDARRALSILESAVLLKSNLKEPVVIEKEDIYSTRKLSFTNREDNHYDVISAFIKSMRGSDPQAAVYYLAYLLESGEDPMFIARRILICASEDIGNADPMALVVASAACQAVMQLGMPEARIPLAQAVTYLSSAPKSNASYLAIDSAIREIRSGSSTVVPRYLRDGTSLSLELRHALEGSEPVYLYPHDFEGGYVKQVYLPEELSGKIFYEPKEIGKEKELKEYLNRLED